MAAMYAVYHGPDGLKSIAQKVHAFSMILKSQVEAAGFKVLNTAVFDTITVSVDSAAAIHDRAVQSGINLRRIDDKHVGVTIDESVSLTDLVDIVNVFVTVSGKQAIAPSDLSINEASGIPSQLVRASQMLPHTVFNSHRSETEMMRYIHHLQSKDLSLVHSMIPLGSCTMKLNSSSSMIPLTWPEFTTIHPFVPKDQARGYSQIIKVGSTVDYRRSHELITHRSSKATCAK